MRRRHTTTTGGEKAAIVVGVLFGAACLILLVGLILMLLWNAVVPVLFAGPVLGFWQAVLFSLLLSFVGNLLRGGRSKE